MPRMGRTVILDKPNGRFYVEETSLPKVSDGQVLIRQEVCGVCGTDAHIYLGHFPGIKYPVCLGHETVGVVEALGKGYERDLCGEVIKEGDRVFACAGLPCGRCYYCVALKEPVLCENGGAYGIAPFGDIHFSGGYADYLYMDHPGSTVVKLDTSPERGCLLEPLTIGIHAADRARLRAGDTVVIQGAGAVGLFCLVGAKETGAFRAIVIGAPKDRLDLAREFGADVTINIDEMKTARERVEAVLDQTRGRGADAVFECAGVPSAFAEGLAMIRKGGTLVEVGHFTDVGGVEINPYHIANKQCDIVGVWGADNSHFVRAKPILESSRYPLEKLISHKLPLERALDAIKALTGSYHIDGRPVRKVVLTSAGR